MSSLLGPYPTEVQGIADELLEYLNGDLQDAASELMDENEDVSSHMNPEQYDKALAFLGKTPAQRDKAVQRLSDRDAALLVLHARYLGLLAARVLRFGQDFDMVRGKSYRNAATWAVTHALRHGFAPKSSEIMPPKEHVFSYY